MTTLIAHSLLWTQHRLQLRFCSFTLLFSDNEHALKNSFINVWYLWLQWHLWNNCALIVRRWPIIIDLLHCIEILCFILTHISRQIYGLAEAFEVGSKLAFLSGMHASEVLIGLPRTRCRYLLLVKHIGTLILESEVAERRLVNPLCWVISRLVAVLAVRHNQSLIYKVFNFLDFREKDLTLPSDFSICHRSLIWQILTVNSSDSNFELTARDWFFVSRLLSCCFYYDFFTDIMIIIRFVPIDEIFCLTLSYFLTLLRLFLIRDHFMHHWLSQRRESQGGTFFGLWCFEHREVIDTFDILLIFSLHRWTHSGFTFLSLYDWSATGHHRQVYWRFASWKLTDTAIYLWASK